MGAKEAENQPHNCQKGQTTITKFVPQIQKGKCH